ncbi:hypothetical protein HC003_01075 [Limosilactobacillus fermentum]|uniref:EpsG family protein n=1 Tax=Limosilactobacillus fermentum TaxID=1613 RepID=UPI0021A69CC8|nr:EpsG family protein [Limosilactobacillus fermentum]MCT3429121.1 hypothetical protein [Limosilactobacillus fermentum]MCT3445835.1 hypothetical protein [Limosilactobacillus fermentum]
MGYIFILFAVWIYALFIRRKGYILAAIAFAWMAYLGGTASPFGTFDYIDYQGIYNRTAMGIDTRTEWLYTSLSKIAINRGLYYNQFRIILIACIFILLYIAVVRLTKKPIYVAAFFMIVPFFQEVTQVRSFAAYTIVLLGISFLDTLSIKKIVFYYMINFLAMGFHTSAGIFLILPLVQYAIEKNGIDKSIRFSIWVSVLLAPCMYLLSKETFVVNLISRFVEMIAGSTVATTFSTLMSVSRGSKSYFLIIYVAYLVLALLISVKGKDALIYVKYSGLYAGFIITFALTPILLISTQFNRLQRYGFELAMIILVVMWSKARIADAKLRLVIVCLVTTVLACAFYGVFTNGDTFRTSIPYLMHWIGYTN